MKKILLLLCTLLGTMGANAETWVSVENWQYSSGGNANVNYFGIVTPSTADAWDISSFSVYTLNYGASAQTRYAAIVDANPNSTSTVSASHVVAISSNAVTANTQGYQEFTLSETATLVGNTTYYIVFLTSNTPSNGNYTQGQLRCGLYSTTYTPGTYWSTTAQTTWACGFTATITENTSTKSVNVTYNLYDESDPTTIVKTEIVSQLAGSAVSIPASLTTGYSTTYYNFVPSSETVETSDCTISVVRSLKNNSVVDVLTKLSNNKVYTISCDRGDLSTYNGYIASTAKTSLGVSAKNFAIISYNDNFYLYSVEDAKYVQSNNTLNTYPTDAALTLTSTSTAPLFRFVYGSNWMNTTSGKEYGVGIDSWTAEDGGNMYSIEEAGVFSDEALAAAIAAFTDRTPYFEALAAVIATADAMSYGTGFGEYVKADGFDAAYSVATTTYANADATIETLETASSNLATAIAACTLNLPSAGFYRIKGKTSGKYLASGFASNNKFAMSDAENATTIFYFDGSKLTNLSSGMCNGLRSGSGSAGWEWVVETSASTVVFQDGLTYGGTYAIKSADVNFYDNGDGTSSADRGGNVTISPTTNARYTSWILEEVTTLPVSISSAEYATLCAPVALNYPSTVMVNTVTIATDNATLNLTEVTGGAIPANTPVLLSGEAGTYNFEITTGVPAIDAANVLVGTAAAIAAPNGSYILQKQEEKVGFFLVDTEEAQPKVPGFRAYLNVPSSSVKAFFFDKADGISSVNVEQAQKDATIFNIAGQRVAKAQKGIYIMNGKKVLVK